MIRITYIIVCTKGIGPTESNKNIVFKMKRDIQLFLFANVVFICASTNPGFEVYLSPKAVDDLVRVVANYYISDLRNLKFEDTNFEHKMGWLGKIHYSFTNVKIIQAQKPFIKTTLADGEIHGSIKSLSLDIEGDWAFKYIHSGGHGKFTLHQCSDLDATFRFVGQNIFKLVKCHSSASCGKELTIHDQNTYPHLVQQTINTVATNIVSSKLNDQICPSIESTTAKSVLYADGGIVLMPGILMNAQPVGAIEITTEGGFGKLAGNVQYGGLGSFSTSNQLEAPPMPAGPVNNPIMGQFMMSSYPISTFIYSLATQGNLDIHLDPSTLSVSDRVYFSTSCLKICLGSYIPQLQKKYPHDSIPVTLKPTEDVRATIGDNDITVSVNYTANFTVNGTDIFTALYGVNVTITPYILNGTITLKGSLKKLSITDAVLIKSYFGHISDDVLQMTSDVIAEVVLKPRVKDILSNTINFVNMFDGVHNTNRNTKAFLNNMHMDILKNTLIFTTNIGMTIDYNDERSPY